MLRLPQIGEAVTAAGLGDGVHLWLGNLDRLGPQLGTRACSEAERERARGMASQSNGTRYLASRALLRLLLSAYCGQAPGAVAIGLSDDGKPFLEGSDLRFNLSHSEGEAAIVVAAERREVGVDIQRTRPVHDELAIAHSLFADAEIVRLERLTGHARHRAFFRLWTCHEAVLKVAGSGIDGTRLELGQDPQGELRLLRAPAGWPEIAIHEFGVMPNFVGAVAWQERGEDTRLQRFDIEAAS